MVPARQDGTDHYRIRHARKIVLENRRRQRHEEAARRLRVYYERHVKRFRVPPVRVLTDEGLVALGSSRGGPGAPRLECTWQDRKAIHIDADGDVACPGNVQRMAEQAKSRDVGGASDAEGHRLTRRVAIERSHGVNRGNGIVRRERAALERRGDESCPEWLGEHERVARPGTTVCEDVVGVNPAGHGESVLQFLVDDGMPADDGCASLMDLVLSSAEDFTEYLDRQLRGRKSDDAERGQWLTAHGVHVGQRVGGSDLAELVRIVDDRREEVDGLDERETVGQPEDPRVIEGLATDKDSGIGSRVQRREGAGKVTRTQLGGSTRAAGELGKAEGFFSDVGHWTDRKGKGEETGMDRGLSRLPGPSRF